MIKRLLNLSKAVLKRAPGVARLIRQRDGAIAALEEYRREYAEVLVSLSTKLRAAVIDDTDAIRERDYAIAELDQYLKDDELRDRVPAKLHAALVERDAYLKQRDQAYRELDDVVQERNHLKGELERLRRELGR
jgi:hypothetical protein